MREDVKVTAADLLPPHEGTRTEAGLRHNVRVGVQYLEAWLRGNGCVPLYNLMEDAATAEISRAQVWQWIRHGAALDDGRVVTAELVPSRAGRGAGKDPRAWAGGDLRAGRFADGRACSTELVLADTSSPTS